MQMHGKRSSRLNNFIERDYLEILDPRGCFCILFNNSCTLFFNEFYAWELLKLELD